MTSIAKFITLCALLLAFPACTLAARRLEYEETLQMSLSAFPPGWVVVRVARESRRWQADARFMSNFSSPAPQFLSAVLNFSFYRSAERATSAFSRFEGNAFSLSVAGNEVWTRPPDLSISVPNAQAYRIDCTDDEDQLVCIYWGLYGSCIIMLESEVMAPHMTPVQFGAIVTTEIDQQMPTVTACYPN
jgi:hypothetical protein